MMLLKVYKYESLILIITGNDWVNELKSNCILIYNAKYNYVLANLN